MSNIYTYSEARQNLATLLDKAAQEGEVKIRRKDGQVFVVKPETKTGSALDVEGIDLDVTIAEIVEFIRESRSQDSQRNDLTGG
ncbi:MAG: type II toxin-antitoxin system Phd/YefM family antitoxin [Anaerolineales bacterium]|jgi:PHD/YefM family antitoxin component YafN of YafNO toxin-antitoxin module